MKKYWILKSCWILAALALCLGVPAGTQAMQLHVQYDRLPGLSAGDRVLFKQREAGRVEAVHMQARMRWWVELQLRDKVSHVLTDHAEFYVIDDPGVPARRAVEIRLGRPGGSRLAEGATVDGMAPAQAGEYYTSSSSWSHQLDRGFDFLDRQMKHYSRTFDQWTRSEQYKSFQENLKGFAAQMQRAGEEARKDLESRWLPQVRNGLENLQRWLREQGASKQSQPESEGRTLYI